MKKIFILAFWCIFIMTPLAACSGTLRVEPDPIDPNLHGQVIRFTVPVVYMELNEEDLGEYTQKEIDIGKILVEEEDLYTLFDIKKTHKIIKINHTTQFNIEESFWIKHDWFTREFASDYQILVLKDNNGVYSVCLRSLLIKSDKPHMRK